MHAKLAPCMWSSAALELCKSCTLSMMAEVHMPFCCGALQPLMPHKQDWVCRASTGRIKSALGTRSQGRADQASTRGMAHLQILHKSLPGQEKPHFSGRGRHAGRPSVRNWFTMHTLRMVAPRTHHANPASDRA